MKKVFQDKNTNSYKIASLWIGELYRVIFLVKYQDKSLL